MRHQTEDGPRPRACRAGSRVLLIVDERQGVPARGTVDELDAGEARELAAELLAAADELEPPAATSLAPERRGSFLILGPVSFTWRAALAVAGELLAFGLAGQREDRAEAEDRRREEEAS